jgi:hypothetical protein
VRPSVAGPFLVLTNDCEGTVFTLYADIKSYITIGIGNMVNSPSLAARLPLRRPDGTLATTAEKIAEWNKIKAGACGADGDDAATCSWAGRRHPLTGIPCFAHAGWKASEKHAATLRLTREDVDKLVASERDRFWAALVVHFPELPSWCADAQLAMLSMGWGLGPHFAPKYPRFSAAVRAGDWLLAAEECGMRESNNPGVRKRNRYNRTLLRNASVVAHDGLDPDVLHWPRDLLTDATPTLPQLHADDEDTQTTTVPAMRPPPSHERVVIVRNNTEMIEELIKGHSANDDDPDAA